MELTEGRRSRTTVVAVVVAVVLAIVVVAQLVLLTGDSGEHTREGETLTAEVATVSSSGRSLCLARDSDDDGDACGFPVVLPRSEGRLVPGTTITATELWVTHVGVTSLTWLVH